MQVRLGMIVAALLVCLIGVRAEARDGIPTAVAGGSLERSIFVPMRDGVRLATDIYLPAGNAAPRSAIVMRTPYRKGNASNIQWAHWFASNGFAVIVQDVRGRWESEGRYDFYSNDRQDFEDLAAWIAAQPWSNQRVGTFGCSYLGEIQIIQAGGTSPFLRAMIPAASSGGTGSAFGRYRYFSGTMGGAYELLAGYSWFSSDGSTIFARLDPDLPRTDYLAWIDRFQQYPPIPEIADRESVLRSLPVVGMLDRAGFPPSNFNYFISTPLSDQMWAARGFLADDTRVDAPALIVNGWHDYGPGESLAQYRFFRERGQSERSRGAARLIMSPATHCADDEAAQSEHYVVGERDVGDTRFPLRDLYVDWFRHWLDNAGEGALDWPAVHYYLMGRNEWRVADDMPIPGTHFTRFYLRSPHSGANGLAGDGALSLAPPISGERRYSAYIYDPQNPNLIISGPLCCDLSNHRTGSYDQRAAEDRDDVLVFTTPPLSEGIEVTGPLRMVLYVESDAQDTDFVGKLMDVYPDGRAMLLQEGILRARYREGFDRVVLMQRGRVYRIEVDLQATGNYFLSGHSIRLEIASSHFPRFDRNLNTGGGQVDETVSRRARNRVYHAPGQESYLVLPVVPEGASRRYAGGR